MCYSMLEIIEINVPDPTAQHSWQVWFLFLINNLMDFAQRI